MLCADNNTHDSLSFINNTETALLSSNLIFLSRWITIHLSPLSHLLAKKKRKEDFDARFLRGPAFFISLFPMMPLNVRRTSTG